MRLLVRAIARAEIEHAFSWYEARSPLAASMNAPLYNGPFQRSFDVTVSREIEWEFIRAAVVPRDRAHVDGTIRRAADLLAAHPALTSASIHTAAILGDDAGVRACIATDPASATARGGPYDWDPLTHLCFSNFLKSDGDTGGFVRAAQALLDAGANANTGFDEPGHEPTSTFESVLYGASGVAHHPELTRLLLEHGAEPNDDEVPYHVGESYDNRAMQVLVESGRLSADSLGMILIRKCDWHDLDGVRWLLARGVDPNHSRRWNTTTLHHAIKRDNSLEIIEALLAHGADPHAIAGGITCVQLALYTGRTEVLARFAARGVDVALSGSDLLLHALAHDDAARIAALAAEHPAWVRDILARGAPLLARWALTGNAAGVRALLELGVPADAGYVAADGYWGIPTGAPALHVAAWLARHEVVELLVARGAALHTRILHDGQLVTPLQLAVRATVDSYWTSRRSPRSVRALLAAGADRAGVRVPSGYEEVDRLLEAQ
jgi:ankyrin repeat protein